MSQSAPATGERQSSVPDRSPFDAQSVRAHLARILKSPDFAAAPQLSVFLEYIVGRKLAGEELSLKAYTIATEALGRDANFDPQTDPIVRVQARRLRQSLLLYYAGQGAGEPLRIVLPVGGYAPEFLDLTAAAAAGPAAPPEKRLFPTPWFAPVALVLSLISIILNLLALWPEAMMFIIDMFR